MLLAFEAVHIHRKLGRGLNVIEEDEPPALELGAVAEIHVLGEGVVLPTACVGDAGFPPDAGGAVEGEKASGTVPCGLLKLKVPVEEHRLNAGEDVERAVEVTPAGLDHADLVVGEIVDRFLQDIRIRDEIRVEDEKVFPFCEAGAVFKRACLVAGAVGAVDVLGIESLGYQAGDPIAADLHGAVGGVVQKLDLNLVLRIIDLGNGIQQAIHHVHFIENRELDGHQRQIRKHLHRHRLFAGVLEVEEDDGEAV